MRELFSRRSFLKLLSWSWTLPALIGLKQVADFIGYRPPAPDPTLIPLGAPQSLPPLPAAIERARIYLMQDDKGYYALDNVCTHLGCLVRPQESGGFACRCHGSRFTADGTVITGPAVQPLPYLELRWDATGQIVVDRIRRVDSAFRLSPKG
ncbi:MAG TPA: ubiquinol-cytochrome c reductase iron-sulfur subunit [Anaerolineales bacterium]|nr:ubiquinol-cytochrome c reductase iron-sulfur subunit [Anaerolineales bacterium]